MSPVTAAMTVADGSLILIMIIAFAATKRIGSTSRAIVGTMDAVECVTPMKIIGFVATKRTVFTSPVTAATMVVVV